MIQSQERFRPHFPDVFGTVWHLMYRSDKYLGFDYEFKIPVKSARTGRLGTIGAKNECFWRGQNGVLENLFNPA
jgi:hypothetical protein